MNTALLVFSYLSLAGQLIAGILTGANNQGVPVPQIRTYVGGKHVAIDITVTPLP